VKNRPPYPLESVDNALRMLHVLRDQGRTSVSEAAAELGIGRSTAHRLLAMLVYRDFAVKDDDHTYRPGPALSAPRTELAETVHLAVLDGSTVRFIDAIESPQAGYCKDNRSV
jgi:DNA-binding IclR family transcriptional regulator